MSQREPIRYYDRATGELKTEKVYARGFLHWSYNTNPGWWATEWVFKQKWVSGLYGWLYRRNWSRRKINPFVRKMDIAVSELTCPLEKFASFNDFFIREIDLSRRAVDLRPGVCIAPVDGRVLAYRRVSPDTTFRIKRSSFNLTRFLQNPALAEEFSHGSMIISRLSLSDYHHFHFPDSGTPGKAVAIEGKYYAGGPYALGRLVPFYAENFRMLMRFESDHFGPMLIVEIGAFAVGSIRQRYRLGARVPKGTRKGFFELGGSTVVLLFHRGAIELDDDLCTNTEKELETYVRLGEGIGQATQLISNRTCPSGRQP